MNDSVLREHVVSRSHGLGARFTIGLALVALLGCGAELGPTEGAPEEPVATSEQFAVWLPANDPLNVEHNKWHTATCGTAGARSCTNRGEDFLAFHRNYLRRLRKKFDELGRTEDIEPWYKLPDPMHSPTNGWTQEHSNAELAVLNNQNPNTGLPFASVDEFGSYLERNLHNDLHGIAQAAYGEGPIGPVGMSPTSTYFFKIHGFVEYLYQRFQRADWTKDGKADVLRRDADGTNSLGHMNGPSITQFTLLPPVPVVCGWRMAGVADLNFDGNPDLIWHGPGCSQVVVWYFNAARKYIGESPMPPANNNWRLVGTGDFNRDLWPDLLWVSNTGALSFEMMDGPTFLGGVTRQVPAGHAIHALGDFDDDGFLDLLFRNLSTMQYKIQYLKTGHVFASAGSRLTNVSGPLDPFHSVVGTGRYHSGPGGMNVDLLWFYDPPCGTCAVELFVSRWSWVTGAGALESVAAFTRGPAFNSPE